MNDDLRRPLLEWYDREHRALPWRRNPTPYRVWVSEIMLQQTQVAAVIPAYRRFLRRFPSLASLAAAREADVLEQWAGLGYYSRARNLLKTARQLVAENGDKLPRDLRSLRELPGIGRYSAGAILSIAFGKPAAMVDGNIARVFSRLFALREAAGSSALLQRAWRRAEELAPGDRPGDWNQALMELGARVCLPGRPRCDGCPLDGRCAARRLRIEGRLPRPRRGRAPVALEWRALWIERKGRLMLLRRSPDEPLLPGHWSLPEPRHFEDGVTLGPRLGRVRHTITHHRVDLEIFSAAPAGRPDTGPGRPVQARWVPVADAGRLLVSSLWRKAVKTARAAARRRVETRR